MLRQNEDGEWMMPRGISIHDMAKEIEDAVRDFTFPDEYVKVTKDDYARPPTLPKVRPLVHGVRLSG